MSQKRNKQRERQVRKQKEAKKPLIDPKYKSMFWTILVIVVLLIFFIINNTRSVPEQGPLPPNYHPSGNMAPGGQGNN